MEEVLELLRDELDEESFKEKLQAIHDTVIIRTKKDKYSVNWTCGCWVDAECSFDCVLHLLMDLFNIKFGLSMTPS